jgi:chromosome segregation ATPase
MAKTNAKEIQAQRDAIDALRRVSAELQSKADQAETELQALRDRIRDTEGIISMLSEWLAKMEASNDDASNRSSHTLDGANPQAKRRGGGASEKCGY